jgi:hypothetical protein
MKSEIGKRKVFMLDETLAGYFLEESILFDDGVADRVIENAFPSARMDFVEAGRCLALGRNNASVYHLMCVAEIGLRALAYDRRVVPTFNKKTILSNTQSGEN